MKKTAAYNYAYRLLEYNDALAHETFEELHRKYPDDSLIYFHVKRLRAGIICTQIVVGGYQESLPLITLPEDIYELRTI